MLTFVIRRLLVVLPMLFFISFLVYLGLELTPGDAVSHMINPDLANSISEQQLLQLRQNFGLDKPFIERYGIWISNVLQGDFGHSLAGGVPIAEIVFDRLPATL